MSLQSFFAQVQQTGYANMAEAVASNIQQMRKEAVRNMFSDFSLSESRLCPVATIRGVHYIDDALAENVNAVWYALENVHEPIYWIVDGERTEGIERLKVLKPWMNKVKRLICVGAQDELRAALELEADRYITVQTLDEAVRMAYLCADEKQTVLYAPLFPGRGTSENSESRSYRFRQSVNEL
ncbi:MAG: hypothetical protein K2H70_01045 [Bacteroidales bacterium]|nr:hypothetical protein [Bacteroidales bacterium]